MMIYHILAFAIGYVLDLLIGDPHSMPHPIRLIGNLIRVLDKKLNKGDEKQQFRAGLLTVVIVLAIVFAVTFAVIYFCYKIHFAAGLIVESILTYYILAARSLYDESMLVYKKLSSGDVEGARYAVSMIVGRDTDVLDDVGIAKAAIETVAENTSDGVIAPMLFTAIGGPVLGFVYKAINTMDSMIGYKNDRYMHFGTAAARLDDVVNFIPSRFSAYLMIFSSLVLGREFSASEAARIHKRDKRKHASPNSAQTESTAAGALGIQLAGDAVYFGKVHKKEFIGDPKRPVEYEDIKRVNRLMLSSAFWCAVICLAVLCIIALVMMKL